MDWIQALISALGGAATVGVPLWIKLRNANVGIKKREAELDIEITKKKAEQDETNKINTEGEWKRILQYRDAELQTLRSRDEAQDKQISDLYNKHIDCEKERARNEAKIEALEKHYGNQIDTLKAEILELRLLLKGGLNNAVPQGTTAPGHSAG